MRIYPCRHSLIRAAVVPLGEMTHPTEAHEFTFGCYRTETVPSLDAPEDGTDSAEANDDANAASDDDRVLATDGGRGSATTCPACESDLANVQGVSACTHCAWNAN